MTRTKGTPARAVLAHGISRHAFVAPKEHMEKDNIWINPRPLLTIEHAGGGLLGNCYHGRTYRITSTRVLDAEGIKAIRATGMIGGGQEFYIRGQEIDGQLVPVPAKLEWHQVKDVKPSGIDSVKPSVRDRRTGKILDEPAIHRYTGEPSANQDEPFYVYVTEDRVDSSD